MQGSSSIPTEGIRGHENAKAVNSTKEKRANREELIAREKIGV
jgi:hypothetical protein